MANLRTCHWCGKRYDVTKVSGGWEVDRYNYCSARCQSAEKRERQRESQQTKEKADKLKKEHPLISFIIEFVLIGYFAVLIIMDFLGSKGNDKQKQNVVENVVQQSIAEEKIVSQSGNTMELASNEEPVSLQTLSQPNSQDDLLVEEAKDVIADQNTIYQSFEEEIDENNKIPIEEEVFSKQKVYDIVDEMPVFPGGDHELMRYIEDNLDYPQEALESGIQGRVFVKIIVEPNGSISNAKIIRGLGYGCDEEAVRVIESMPNWEPGRKRGESVRVYMTIPVKFKLQ